MCGTTIYQKGEYRIHEYQSTDYNIQDLKGECFDPEVVKDIPKIELKKEEENFERRVLEEGVYGYTLEKWNREVDKGWEVLDSCFDFIGRYETEKHYIVAEFIEAIEGL